MLLSKVNKEINIIKQLSAVAVKTIGGSKISLVEVTVNSMSQLRLRIWPH
jgi:hypothetical protein